jgi:uncharacterized protein YaaQ
VKLVLAVVQTPDLQPLLQDLTDQGWTATQIEGDAAAGRGALAALMVGVDDDQLRDLLAVVRARTRRRLEPAAPLRPIGELAEFWIPGATDQVLGGASVYVLPVNRFERMGYA